MKRRADGQDVATAVDSRRAARETRLRLAPAERAATTPHSRASAHPRPHPVFGVALAVRIVHMWQIRERALFTVLMGDSRGYDEWARRIAAGDWIGTRRLLPGAALSLFPRRHLPHRRARSTRRPHRPGGRSARPRARACAGRHGCSRRARLVAGLVAGASTRRRSSSTR